jgi:hypothetical protein
MRKLRLTLALLTGLGLAAWSGTAAGRISGKVVDLLGRARSGLKVELVRAGTSVAEAGVLTGPDGSFVFAGVEPSSYTLLFQGQGGDRVRGPEIEVKPEGRMRIDISLGPAPGRHGELATSQTLVETRFLTQPEERAGSYGLKRDFLERIPVARDSLALLANLPGIMTDRLDVSGNATGSAPQYWGGGTFPDDTIWSIDGMNVTDPSAIGGSPLFTFPDAIREIDVFQGGTPAEYASPGAVINIVGKSGSNRLSGQLSLYDQPFGFFGGGKVEGNAFDLSYPKMTGQFRGGLQVGGPIVKDKLWFYASFSPNSRSGRNAIGETEKGASTSGLVRLDYKAGDSRSTAGRLLFGLEGDKLTGLFPQLPGGQEQGAAQNLMNRGLVFSGNFQHSLGGLNLSARVSLRDNRVHFDPWNTDIDSSSGHNEGADTVFYGAGWGSSDPFSDHQWDKQTFNVSLDGNYFLNGALGGDHEIRFGVDYYTAGTQEEELWPNQRALFVNQDGSGQNYLRLQPDFNSDVNFKRISAYVQDTITWGKLTANFGLRFDREQGGVNAVELPRFTWYEPGSPDNGRGIDIWGYDPFPKLDVDPYSPDYGWSTLSPRLAFTYDLTGDGKNIIKLSAGRYVSGLGFNPASYLIPRRGGYVPWTDTNGDGIPQYPEVCFDGLLPDYLNDYCPDKKGSRSEFDPDYNSPYLTELTLAFEKAMTDDLAVSLTGFYKKQSRLANDIDSRGRPVPVRSGLMGDGSIETNDNWIQSGTSTVGGTSVPIYTQQEMPWAWYYHNLEDAYNRYLGIQIQLNKKLSDGWMANASFTFQDWKRFRQESETLDRTNFDFFNEGAVAPVNPVGYPYDFYVNSRWMVNLSGLYQLPLGIVVSGYFQAREGNPSPRYMPVLLPQGQTFLYPSEAVLGEDRLPTFWMLNLGLEKTVKVMDALTATLTLDWYNALNKQNVLRQDSSIGADVPEEPVPILWSNAGLFQFGVRVNF